MLNNQFYLLYVAFAFECRNPIYQSAYHRVNLILGVVEPWPSVVDVEILFVVWPDEVVISIIANGRGSCPVPNVVSSVPYPSCIYNSTSIIAHYSSDSYGSI